MHDPSVDTVPLSRFLGPDEHRAQASKLGYLFAKRCFDIVVSILLLPLLVLSGLVLLFLNPFYNPGRLLYVQARMGRDCKAFAAIKFRSMSEVERVTRGADDPIEDDRITQLGRLIRKFRIDEVPQILNVLKGEMSLIGPRPDYFHHARRFLRHVPGYRERHLMRPGISGLAQTEVGYVVGAEATSEKVAADLHYIQNAGFRMDTWVFWRTLVTVFGARGA